MIEITGKYTNAKIFTDNIEPDAIKQITFLCNHPLFEKQPISIMPDVHPSKSTVVGLSTRLRITNLIPSLIGVDAGCGMLMVKLKGKINDFAKLDKVIHNLKPGKYVYPRLEQEMEEVCSIKSKWIKDKSTYLKHLGTLGGGNHFISVEQGETGTYLIIHTGSRSFGYDVALHYMDLALQQNPYAHCGELKQLSWLNEDSSKEYLKAVQVAQLFAENNRYSIAQNIIKEMKWKLDDWEIYHPIGKSMMDIPHNFLYKTYDDEVIIRKGCQRLNTLQTALIPINMADGSLLIKGKDLGSFDTTYQEWNWSMAHGAGRLYNRQDSKNLDMKEFKQRMKNVYSSCVNVSTIDESPMAYKSIGQIRQNIKPICDIVDHLIPKYNYKAGKND